MNKEFLNDHYDSILANNREKILSGGCGDAFLDNARSDNRMALVVLIRISAGIADRINSCIDEIREFEPDLYFYPAEDLHVTVMDILKGEEGRSIPQNIDDYIQCIREAGRLISPFNIMFDGLTASDNAVMVRGYYDDELMIFRQNLREMFKKRGLLLEERYETVSSHITIARLYDKYWDPERLLNYIEKPQVFGTMTVSEMELSFHNWYDTRKERISTIYL